MRIGCGTVSGREATALEDKVLISNYLVESASIKTCRENLQAMFTLQVTNKLDLGSLSKDGPTYARITETIAAVSEADGPPLFEIVECIAFEIQAPYDRDQLKPMDFAQINRFIMAKAAPYMNLVANQLLGTCSFAPITLPPMSTDSGTNIMFIKPQKQ